MTPPNENEGLSFKVWTPFLLSLFLVGGMLIGSKIGQQEVSYIESTPTQDNHDYLLGAGKVEDIIRYIDARYVDSVDRKALVDKAIEEVLGQLDPHSVYTGVERSATFQGKLDGKTKGLGIVTLIDQDTLLVLDAVD